MEKERGREGERKTEMGTRSTEGRRRSVPFYGQSTQTLEKIKLSLWKELPRAMHIGQEKRRKERRKRRRKRMMW